MLNFDKEQMLEIAEAEVFCGLSHAKRVSLLNRMENFLRENIQDEEVFDYWLTLGLPDMPSESDIDYVAGNPSSLVDCLYAFVMTVLNDCD